MPPSPPPPRSGPDGGGPIRVRCMARPPGGVGLRVVVVVTGPSATAGGGGVGDDVGDERCNNDDGVP